MCNKLLDSTNCSEHEGELFCKVCHARKYGPKGYGFGGGAGCLSMDQGEHLQQQDDVVVNHAPQQSRAIAKAPEGEGCPRCGGFVYAAEQMCTTRTASGVKSAIIRSTVQLSVTVPINRSTAEAWHRECFKCGLCAKGLDSRNCCEAPDKNIYCKVCYGKKFGPKGYGYGQGGGALQSDSSEAVNGESQAPHTTVIDTAIIKAAPGQGCPRCGGVVFAAEQVLAKGSEWHRKCFKCRDCNKTLDSIIACDGPDKDVYCKTCYGKKWGPHGYGFACGSGFLQTDGLT
ncbi:unnamed protein product, partial [Timema podura]|nr:unnamed protein product [Timema podura]